MVKKKKLPEILPEVEAAMLASLEYAIKYPEDWHKIGFDPIHKQAIEELKTQGVIEIWPETALYRILK